MNEHIPIWSSRQQAIPICRSFSISSLERSVLISISLSNTCVPLVFASSMIPLTHPAKSAPYCWLPCPKYLSTGFPVRVSSIKIPKHHTSDFLEVRPVWAYSGHLQATRAWLIWVGFTTGPRV